MNEEVRQALPAGSNVIGRMHKSYNLYPEGRDFLGVAPNGPIWGILTVTDEIDTNVRPYPLRKCLLEIYDEPARQHWGDARKEFWIRNEGDSLVKALAHLNGQSE